MLTTNQWLLILGTTVGIGLFFYYLKQSRQTLDARTRFAGEKDVSIGQQPIVKTENLDPIFYPSPAISERIQSVQWSHIEDQMSHFDLDYQPHNKFQLVSTDVSSVDGFRQTVSNQIDLMKSLMYRKFGNLATAIDISTTTFDAPFNAMQQKTSLFLRNLTPSQVIIESLIPYIWQINDTLFLDIHDIFYGYHIDINPDGSSKNVRATQIKHENQQNLTQVGNIGDFGNKPDGLSQIPRNTGLHNDLQKIAERYLHTTYRTLLDKYKYSIHDVNGNDFRKRAPEILKTGQELMAHYFISGTPSKNELDNFSSEVDESMKESLFEILMQNGVDVTQFD